MNGCQLINGIVDQVDENAVRVKVRFPDLNNMLSGWLAVGNLNTERNKDYHLYDQGEHVACLMDSRFEHGYALFAIYDQTNPPPVAGLDKRYVRFTDGGHIEYDRNTSTLSVEGIKTVRVEAQIEVLLDVPQVRLTGNLQVDGDIHSDGDTTAGSVSLKNHTHTGDSGGNTSQPQ